MTYDLYGQYRWWLAFLVCIFLSAPFWHVSFDCGFFFKFFTSETYFQHIYLEFMHKTSKNSFKFTSAFQRRFLWVLQEINYVTDGFQK